MRENNENNKSSLKLKVIFFVTIFINNKYLLDKKLKRNTYNYKFTIKNKMERIFKGINNFL